METYFYSDEDIIGNLWKVYLMWQPLYLQNKLIFEEQHWTKTNEHRLMLVAPFHRPELGSYFISIFLVLISFQHLMSLAMGIISQAFKLSSVCSGLYLFFIIESLIKAQLRAVAPEGQGFTIIFSLSFSNKATSVLTQLQICETEHLV